MSHIHDHKRCNEPLPNLTAVWVLRHQWRVRTTAFHTVLSQEARQRTTNLLKTLSRSASVAEDAARLMGDSARFSSVHEGTMVHTCYLAPSQWSGVGGALTKDDEN